VAETPSEPQRQLALFHTVRDPLRERLAALDIDHITPIQALTILSELKTEAPS
jgi:hypothetical protein